MGCPKCEVMSKSVRDISACREPGTQDLVVPEGESLVLSPHVDKYAALFVQINPKTMREMKEIIGVPDGLHATSGREKLSLSSAPAKFVGQNGPEAGAANVFVRVAAKEFIYRDSAPMAAFVPQMERLLPSVVLHVALIQDLIVRQNSTLVIPRGVDRLTVRDVTIERGGRLAIRGGNVLIRAQSFRGQLPSPRFTVGGITVATRATVK